MRWRDDWPADAWGNGPLPPDTPGGTPTGVFNATFRTKYTSGIMGVGSTVPDFYPFNAVLAMRMWVLFCLKLLTVSSD